MKKIIALFLTVLMLISLVACGGNKRYVNPDHSLVALKSENFEITNGMLSYLYLYGFYNVYSSYQSYFDSMGFNYTQPLDQQQYGEDMTWHDYFLDMTMGDARNFLRVAEAARAAGYSDDYVEAAVDAEIAKILENEKMTLDEYMTKMFGDALDETDLRNALALQIYAYDYYEELQADLDEGITTEECETYYNDNVKTLSKVDYISYTVTASTANTDDTEAAYALALQKARELVAETEAKGIEGFKTWVRDYMTEQNADSTAPMTEDALAAQIDKVLAGTVGASYSEGDAILEFCYEEGRKAGDCKLTDNGAGSYTVTVITATPHRAEGDTRDVRHILFKPETYNSAEAAKLKAEQVLDTWKKGEATEESFDALAEEHNDDGSSLYENVRVGEMVETFNDWLFDGARVPGDTGIVETDYGYHIMYFVGEGHPVWETEIRSTLVTSKLSAAMTEFESEHAITENAENIAKLPTTVPQSAMAVGGESVTPANVY